MKKLLVLFTTALLLAVACGSSDDEGSDAASGEDASFEGEASSSDGAGGEAYATTAAAAESGGGGFDAEAPADGDALTATDEADSAAEPATAELTDAAGSDDGDTAARAESEAAEEAAADIAPPSSTTIAPPPREQPQAGILTAADIDDNLNFEFFNDYLARVESEYPSLLGQSNLRDRITIEAVGANGVGLANARLDIDVGSEDPIRLFTSSSGIAHFFPSLTGAAQWDELAIDVVGPDGQTSQGFVVRSGDLGDNRRVTLQMGQLDGERPSALDVALVIDTTGSMGDELAYLNAEFTSIVGRLADDYPGVDMRFALLVYRDDGDEYITEAYDFTADVSEMQAWLNQQRAEGGGDYPEAMDLALTQATELSWRSGDVARVMIVNADAPPHDNGFRGALAATATARENGIRIYPLAASGVGDTAEYLMRFMATTTGGRHLFLTDDSGVGAAHQEPKVQCYVVTRLDHLIVRVLASEITGERLEPFPNQLIRTVGDYDNGHCSDAG